MNGNAGQSFAEILGDLTDCQPQAQPCAQPEPPEVPADAVELSPRGKNAAFFPRAVWSAASGEKGEIKEQTDSQGNRAQISREGISLAVKERRKSAWEIKGVVDISVNGV